MTENTAKKIVKVLDNNLALSKEVESRLLSSRNLAVSKIKVKRRFSLYGYLKLNKIKVIGGLITAGAMGTFVFNYVYTKELEQPKTAYQTSLESIKSLGVEDSSTNLNKLEIVK